MMYNSSNRVSLMKFKKKLTTPKLGKKHLKE